MKKTAKWLSLLLAVVMIMSLAACSGKSAAPSAAPKPTEAASGGTLSIVSGGTLSNVLGYPIAGGFIEHFVSCPAIETLGRYNEKGDIVGWLAKEIKADPAGLKVVLELNQGIKFHDGTDFNAKAVCDVWTITKNNGYSNKFTNVGSYEATGDYQVTVKLTSWAYDTVNRLCVEAGWMFSPTNFNSIGLEKMYTKIVGTGPFTLKDYKIGESVEYVKNSAYWIKGQPYLDGIKFIITKDHTSAANILKSGGAQVMTNFDAKTFSELTKAGFQRLGVDTCISPTLFGVFFASGNQKDAMSKLEVRQAFCHAIDTAAINKAFTYGTGATTNQLAVKGTKEYNDKVVGYPYSVEKAKELLKKAGYSDTNKPTVTLTYQAKDSDLYVSIQGYLQTAGFDVKLDAVDSTVYADRIVVGRSAPFQSVAQWMAPTKMENWTRYFTEKPSTMIVNCIDLKQAGVIDTYKDIMYNTDSAKQKEAAMKLQKLIVDDYCLFFPLYTSPNLVAGTAKVQNSGIGMTYISAWTPESTKLAK